MMSKEAYLARTLRLQSLVRIALLVLFLCQLLTSQVRGAEDAADPYDTLYDVIMTRYGPDGKSYAENEASPVIFKWSDFPFGDKTFRKFNAALDAFAALPQAKIEAYSDIKRALLQRHLWKVVDATHPVSWQLVGKKYGVSHLDRRDAVRPKIASLIRRLALTRTRILALPHTMAVTVKSGGFPQRHDPMDRLKPFLPADLYTKESSWICFGEDYRSIPADIHSRKLNWRSAFLQFMRVPGGRIETLRYMKKLNNHQEIFPVGTQFALIEQAFLVSDKGELILSPLIVSIQLRAYLNVNQSVREARPEATQSVAEFVMQPRQLMKGNAVMKALNPRDHRYEAGDDADGQSLSGGAKDPFETGEMPITRLNLCMRCHGPAGLRSVKTVFSNSYPLFETSPEAISKATSTKKRDDDTWKTLHELWQADTKNKGSLSPARADQPQPPLDNKPSRPEQAKRRSGDKGKPEDRPPAAAATSSAFDELYDVLMVRHARNGVAYGENEIAPMIFKFSKFPFDDATYPRLTAALDAITPETIRTCSHVQRAILQRQLWALFDATAPSRVFRRRPDDARRLAVQKQLAGLIRQLALKRTEIESLPDTLQTTVKAKRYPTEFDLEKPTSPFLPPDLTEDSSPWICFGRGRTPVNLHATDGRWRSAFFQFIRLPGARQATIQYIDHWSQEKPFPAGTQFALVEKAFLVSDKGEMVLSPMTVSTQLRAYRNVEQSFRDAGTATQCVAEFISRPRDYLRGNALMAAVSPTDYRVKTVRSDGGKQDALELVNDPRTSVLLRLGQCMYCHGGAGTNSLGDVVAPRGTLKSLQRRSQSEIVQATAKSKRDDKSWKILQELWMEGSK